MFFVVSPHFSDDMGQEGEGEGEEGITPEMSPDMEEGGEGDEEEEEDEEVLANDVEYIDERWREDPDFLLSITDYAKTSSQKRTSNNLIRALIERNPDSAETLKKLLFDVPEKPMDGKATETTTKHEEL